MKIEKLHESILYTNPKPLLRSRHSCFPFACELDNGDLLAAHVLAEAFESVDGTTYTSISRDQGKTWELQSAVYDKSANRVPTTDSMKPTNLGSQELVLFGYEFFRDDPELTLSNSWGGLLDDRIILLRSSDNGQSWTSPEEVPCSWGRHVEASAPITVLDNGDWITPITGFPKWDGTLSAPLCARLLRSHDRGRTWNDDTIIMDLGEHVTTYEQRLCVLEKSKALVDIAWNEDLKDNKRYNNHYALSYDRGKTFTGPFDTGIPGQTASVCSIGGDRLLSLHAIRRDTSKPGIYAYIVNLENGKWEIEAEDIIWEPNLPIVKDNNMAEVFSYLKFGQPGAIMLTNGTVLTTHWIIEAGQGKSICMVLKITD